MSQLEDTRGPAKFEQGLAAAAAGPVVFDEERPSFGKRLQRFLHAYPTIVPFIVLLLGMGLGASVNWTRFTTGSNLSTILLQVTIIGILGIAQTLIILTAGIDLSVGIVMVLCSIVMGRLGVGFGWPGEFAFAMGIVVGALCGLLNGLLVTRLRMPPFIVTLGTLSIFTALNTWYSQSESIRNVDLQDKAPFLLAMGQPIQVGTARIIDGSLFMLVIAGVVWFVLNRTAFGRHVYAVGDDPEAARLAGIDTGRTLVKVYVIAGLISAIAGWVLIGRVGAVSPTSGQDANLDSITAVVIGGTSLFGGRGSIVGTLIGALIVGVFRSSVSLAGLDVLWQQFAVGVLIIVAVALDQWIRKVSA
jgi:fructose transport system permease protein